MNLTTLVLFSLALGCRTGAKPADTGENGTDGGATDGGTSDGGTSDGGTSDGGTSDGGTSDGGTLDGGTTDGGTTDGGTTDGGTSDGGTSDGGTSDGGTSDGGTSDGGTSDGGTSDGGTSDGGTSDGGTSDGGTSDGGTSDGGTSDGGTSDGGTSDGGTSDGGTSDGGTTDGGTTDGGTSDGGTSDGGTEPIDADGDGFTTEDGDCNDADASVNPDAAEVCNDVDDDCDDEVDEGVTTTYYADADEDGFGDAASSADACDTPDGFTDDASDCNDADAAVNPDAAEVCNELDDNCDDEVDEGVTTTYYADADEDGFGDAASSSEACDTPDGYTDDNSDCNDADASVNPDAAEVCNDVDDDCDDEVDEGVTTTYYADADEDGFGDAASSSEACDTPDGYTADASDCNDADASVNPDATEVCNGVDDNCDDSVDGSDAWWDSDWPYRVPITLTAASSDVDGPPVAVEVDFAGALADLGSDAAFEADTVRVVLQDCDLDQPELPSQVLDGWTGVFDKVASEADEGDGFATVAFLFDEDGDYASLETLAAGSEVALAIYFGGSASAPTYETDLLADGSGMATDLSLSIFDDAQGGLLDSLTLDGATTLMSQTDSCCGNSIYTDASGWGNDPQDGDGTLTLHAEGPVFAALEATGSRTDDSCAYDYSYLYWMFAGRPELWTKTYAVTTADCENSHSDDYTNGIRPWESRQDELSGSSDAVFTLDETAFSYADVSDGSQGVAWGYVQPPTYLIGLSNYDPYLIMMGNDYADTGTGTPGTVPLGTAFFEHIVQVVYPHDGAFTDVEDDFFGLVEGVGTSLGAAEAQ